jgi:disulfide bond formation protein DsbB
MKNIMFKIKNELLILSLLLIAIVFAWYLQIFQGVEPCSLCLLQRWGVYLGIFFVVIQIFCKFFVNKIISIISYLLIISSNIFSISMAYRNVWLQHLPPEDVPSCGADLETLLSQSTILNALRKTFIGSGECAEKSWIFLDLSLATWSSIYFSLLLLVEIYIFYRLMKGKK